jgi:hypothetical protein
MKARTTCSMIARFLLLAVAASQGAAAAEPGEGLPPPKDAGAWTLSDQTYRVRHLPQTAIPGGYAVEGRIPLASLEQLGFPRLRPGVTIRCGLYRAEFSHDRSSRPVEPKETIHNRGRKSVGSPPIEHWISWVDPQTPEPDFHVPSSLGRLKIVD